ncbi:MAG: MaoC family dehydratase N-terminal domain-containing protein [Anaerolineae bacterium]|jgi:acyl dehydratase|nr:MaoC family dehydratase N-terminal domain-containing protein [Anaerolineae bacterium]
MRYTPQGPMGYYFEDCAVGDVHITAGRTITEADIVNFGGIIGDYNPIHFDAEYVKGTFFGQRIAHGMLTLSFATGLVNQLGANMKTILAFKGLEFEFRAPVFIGDTIHVEMTTTETRRSGKLPGGWVTQQVQIIKQDGTVVQQGQWSALIALRPE